MKDQAIKLTAQQEKILEMVKVGQTNKAIAKRLGLSESTVKMHVGSLLKKYAAKNRQHLMLSALKGVSPQDIPDVLPADAEPFGWVLIKGGKVVGVMFTKECGIEGWEPIYKLREK
jgi:DNA-binding CsgD family transcriptional regulator